MALKDKFSEPELRSLYVSDLDSFVLSRSEKKNKKIKGGKGERLVKRKKVMEEQRKITSEGASDGESKDKGKADKNNKKEDMKTEK